MNVADSDLIERLKRTSIILKHTSSPHQAQTITDAIQALEAQQRNSVKMRELHDTWMDNGFYVVVDPESPFGEQIEAIDITITRQEMELFESFCSPATPPEAKL